MGHLTKVVLGVIGVGGVLGLILFFMLVNMEEVFVDIDGHLKSARRGPLILPILLGVAAGWAGIKGLERISGISGSVVIFVLSLVGAGVAFGITVGLGLDQFERISTEQSMILAGLSAVAFIITATLIAYMDE